MLVIGFCNVSVSAVQKLLCIGLCTNAQKTKVMTCILGKIRVSLLEEVYNDCCLGASTHAARK